MGFDELKNISLKYGNKWMKEFIDGEFPNEPKA